MDDYYHRKMRGPFYAYGGCLDLDGNEDLADYIIEKKAQAEALFVRDVPQHMVDMNLGDW